MIARRALLASSAALIAGAAAAQQAAPLSLTAVDVHPNEYPTVEAVRWLGEELSRETGGRLSIRLYPGGQLGAENDTVALTRFEVLDFCRVTAAALNNAFPLTSVLTLPYTFRDEQHIRAVCDGAIGRTILDSFIQRDLIGLCFYDGGVRSLYNVRGPVHEPGDLRGLKVRVPRSDMFMQTLNGMGANATPIPFGEVFSGLQTHLIDGAENNWSTYQSTRQYEIARYWSETRHAYSPDALLFSRARFEQLSVRDRDLLIGKAQESVAVMRRLWVTKQDNARAAAIASGIEVNETDHAAFEAALAPLRQSHRAKPELGALLRRIEQI